MDRIYPKPFYQNPLVHLKCQRGRHNAVPSFFTKKGRYSRIFITFAYLATIVAFFCCFFCPNFRVRRTQTLTFRRS